MSTKITMNAKNKAFWAKPKEQQRIAISKDVLKQLSIKTIKAKIGDYFEVYDIKEPITKVPEKMDDLLRIFKRTKNPCSVCAIGACFVGLVNMGNKIPVKGFLSTDKLEGWEIGNTDIMREALRKVFPSVQISLLEMAFEKYYTLSDNEKPDEESMKMAILFGEKYTTDKKRLIAIMKNIIKNKGEFIP